MRSRSESFAASYQDLKGRYTARAEQAQRAIDLLREEIEKAVNNNSNRLRWTQHFKAFSTMTELDRRAVIAMVQSIRVVGKEDLEITFRYKSEYEQTLEKLARSAKAERRTG